MSGEARRGDRAVLVGGFLAALALRAFFAAAQKENFDLGSFEIVAGIVDHGGNVYAETRRYNYAPVWAYLLWTIGKAGAVFGMPLARAVTAFLFAVDAASAWLIFRILRSRGAAGPRAGFGALLFFSNPLSVFISSYLAMFDDVALLLLLVSVDAMVREPVQKARAVLGMTGSILVKHVAWFHPLLLARRKPPRVSLIASLVPYAVFLASLAPFWASRNRIRAQIFGYESMGEPYGTEALRFWRYMPVWGTRALCVAAALACVVWVRQRDVAFDRACLLLFLVLLIFLPGIAPYYFIWPVAFGALYPSAGYAVYTGMVTLFLIHSPDAMGVELPHLPGWSGPWWSLVFWFLWEVRSLSKARAAIPTR